MELFDCAPFGVSRTEALLIDPQQRLLLEAMLSLSSQHSGHCSGERRGVFVGMSSIDYARLTARYSPEATAYSATGAQLQISSCTLFAACDQPC